MSNLEVNGAVVFGHSLRLRWHWPDEGHPVRGYPPVELAADTGAATLNTPQSSGSSGIVSPTRSSQLSGSLGAGSGSQANRSNSSAFQVYSSMAATTSTRATSVQTENDLNRLDEGHGIGEKRKRYPTDVLASVARRARGS